MRSWTILSKQTTNVPGTGGALNYYNGIPNTTNIVAQAGAGVYAAQYASDYSVVSGGVTYNDWYLPSMLELNMVFNSAAQISNSMATMGFPAPYFLTSNPYFSSTEYNNSTAFMLDFKLGYMQSGGKGASYYTLPVRIATI